MAAHVPCFVSVVVAPSQTPDATSALKIEWRAASSRSRRERPTPLAQGGSSLNLSSAPNTHLTPTRISAERDSLSRIIRGFGGREWIFRSSSSFFFKGPLGGPHQRVMLSADPLRGARPGPSCVLDTAKATSATAASSSTAASKELFPSPDAGASVRRVGILGGGQLARMMIYAANRLNMAITVVDPDPHAPGGQVADHHVVGNFRDAEAVRQLAAMSDVVTVEIEHVNTDAMAALEAAGISVEPSPKTVALIQDKYTQKVFMRDHGVPLGRFVDTKDRAAVEAAAAEFGYPFVLKAKRLAYDGRGNAVIRTPDDIGPALEQLGKSGELFAEAWVPFTKELAVMVVRGLDGEVRSYPVVETIQSNNVCLFVISPAQVSAEVTAKAKAAAERAVQYLDGAGIFGVELFLLPDGQVLFNEIAPRPHNSGHYTIEGCVTDQFEQHLRAVTGLPLGDPSLKVGGSVMVNILGGPDDGDFAPAMNAAMIVPGATVHWYGKREARPGRKLGHITFCGDSVDALLPALAEIGYPLPASATASGSTPSPSSSSAPTTASTSGKASGASSLFAPKASTSGVTDGRGPLVGIIMGSDSDLPTMRAAAEVLRDFDIPFELTIVSAHRTPQRMMEYARDAHKRGLKAIIAGAGGAAHLPGMVASMTPLPVIGVPVRTRGALDGVDALYSIVSMPKGVPVATVAIDNAANAGLLAIRLVGTSDPAVLDKMVAYQEDMRSTVLDKADKLATEGWDVYGTAKPAGPNVTPGFGFRIT